MAKIKIKNDATSGGKKAVTVSVPAWAGHLLALFTILGVGLASYSGSFTVPFVLDDVTSILTNPLVKSFDFSLKSRIIGDLSFAINYRLHGFELAGYHVFNFMLHLLNALFVYLLVQLTLRTPVFHGFPRDRTWSGFSLSQLIGFGAALLFVSHPLQTQAVTYLAQRVAVLAASCYLGAILSYAASRLSQSRTAGALLLALSLVMAVAAVMTKENAVTIPLAILLFELTFFRGDLKPRLLSMVLYLLPLVVILPVMLGRIGFSADLLGEVSRFTAESGAPSRTSYLLTQFPVIVSYLRLFLLPLGQNLDHDILLRTTLADPVVFGSFFVLSALAACGCRLWLQAYRATDGSGLKSLLGFGAGWFVITLSVESSVIPIRDVMFEHRLYLPSVGLAIVVSVTVWQLVTWWRSRDDGRAEVVFLLVFVFLGVLLGTATFLRNRVWQSEVTLWQDVVKKSPGKARAHGSLGHALQRGQKTDEALRSYQRAVQLAPGDHITRNNLGVIYLSQNKPIEALEQFRQALISMPSSSTTHYNMGLAYASLEQFDKAAASYREAVRLGGESAQLLNNLGIVLYRQGHSQEALASFREAVRRNPENAEAAANLVALEKALKVSRER